MQTKYIIGIVVVLIILSVIPVYFGKKIPGMKTQDVYNNLVPGGPGSKTQDNSVSQSGTSINISNFAFSPINLSVKKGTSVTWVNDDSMPHTVTSKKGIFSSRSLSKGDTFSYTFNSVGSYDYICNFHPSMSANITVTE